MEQEKRRRSPLAGRNTCRRGRRALGRERRETASAGIAVGADASARRLAHRPANAARVCHRTGKRADERYSGGPWMSSTTRYPYATADAAARRGRANATNHAWQARRSLFGTGADQPRLQRTRRKWLGSRSPLVPGPRAFVRYPARLDSGLQMSTTGPKPAVLTALASQGRGTKGPLRRMCRWRSPQSLLEDDGTGSGALGQSLVASRHRLDRVQLSAVPGTDRPAHHRGPAFQLAGAAYLFVTLRRIVTLG
jgi:hypothetical protein